MILNFLLWISIKSGEGPKKREDAYRTSNVHVCVTEELKHVINEIGKHPGTCTLKGRPIVSCRSHVQPPSWSLHLEGVSTFKNMITEVPVSISLRQSCHRKSSLFEATLAGSDRSHRRAERWHECEMTWICYEADSGCQVRRRVVVWGLEDTWTRISENFLSTPEGKLNNVTGWSCTYCSQKQIFWVFVWLRCGSLELWHLKAAAACRVGLR